jgi:hypothetical protein
MGDDATFVYGDGPPVQATTHTGHAAPEDIIAIGKQIWSRVCASGVGAKDDAGNDKLLTRLQNEFKDFNASFPIVMRWMVQMRQFNDKALHKYLLKHGTANLDTREAFLDLQAEYLVLLYREEHPRADRSFINQYRASLVAQLRKEDKEFMDMNATVEAELKDQQAKIDRERREEIYVQLLARRVKAEAEAEAGGAR